MTNLPRRPKALRDALSLLLRDCRQRVEAGVRSPATLEMHEAHVGYLLERIPARTPLRHLTSRRIALALAKEGRGRRELADGSVVKLSGSTLRKRASTLRRALTLSRREGWLRRVPEFPEIPHRYVPSKAHLVDFDAYARLRDALPAHRRLWFVVAVWTGQRASDVERMKREDLDVNTGTVVIRSTKTKRGGRSFHAAPELVRELEAHWRELPAGAKLVAPWPHVSSQLTRLCERLELPHTTAQALRHTLFTWFVAANGFTAELLELGGWRDLTVPALVYAHAAPKRLREQIERTDELIVGPRRAPQKVSREREPSAVGNGPDGSGGAGVDAPAPPTPARTEPGSARGDGGAAGSSPDEADSISTAGSDLRVGVERIELSTNGLRAVPTAATVPSPLSGSVVLDRSQTHAHRASPRRTAITP